MKYFYFFFLLILSQSSNAQLYKFNDRELLDLNISKVLEHKVTREFDNWDSLIIHKMLTSTILMDKFGISATYGIDSPPGFGSFALDSILLTNGKPKVVLYNNGTVCRYFYSTIMEEKYDSLSGLYFLDEKLGLPDSIVVWEDDRVWSTYKYTYTYGLDRLLEKQRLILGEWHFCHHFNKEYVPAVIGDTLILKRNYNGEKCRDLHLMTFDASGSISYSSDSLLVKGLPYPDNYKGWTLFENGLFLSKKNKLPSDRWEVLFENEDTLYLIYR